jgi:hypothetical protein
MQTVQPTQNTPSQRTSEASPHTNSTTHKPNSDIMPRQGRSGSAAPRRPTVAPSRPAPAAQQTRPATTAAYPPARAAPPPPAPVQAQAPQSQGPGLFGQMASTAAGVAVGSSIGHAIGGFFGGGSSAPAEQQSNNVATQTSQEQNSFGARSCEIDAKAFTKCLDDNQGNMQICNWYLEQLVRAYSLSPMTMHTNSLCRRHASPPRASTRHLV